jgi:asparagine synthase (glutamine-hydrolysing)
VHPLLSQPLVELALRIPTYQSFEDGYDRIFLRKAVSRLKTGKALWRKMKGQTTGTLIKSFSKQYTEIHDLLMSGSLIKSGIINERWLNNELIKAKHGSTEHLWPIINMISSQRWLNQWDL